MVPDAAQIADPFHLVKLDLDINDRGRPRLATPLPDPDGQHLIQPDRDRLSDPGGILDQRVP